MLALIITIILGISGIIVTFLLTRWQVKRNQIDHFFTNSYDIGIKLTADFPNYKLHYGNELIENNVKVLKGGFMNTGRNDIDGLNGYSDFTLSLPANCIVRDVNVSPSDDKLIVKATVNNENKNSIDFGINNLFITNEYFKYSAIVEVPESVYGLEDRISFNHRLKNTEKIRNIHIGHIQTSIKRKKRARRMIFVFAGGYVLLVLLSLCQELKFNIYQKETNKEVVMMISPKSDIYVGENNTFSIPVITGEKITIDEFNNNYKVFPRTSYRWFYTIWVVVFYLVLFLVFCFLTYEEFIGKKSHIIKVLNKDKANKIN